VSVQAISEAKYISALQQNINLVQASLPLNRELQFKGKPQGLTVTRFSSRNTHPVCATKQQTNSYLSPRIFLAEEYGLLSEHLNEVIV
jgi:hypothetical protein